MSSKKKKRQQEAIKKYEPKLTGNFFIDNWFIVLLSVLLIGVSTFYIYDSNKGKLKGKKNGGEDVVYTLNDTDTTSSEFYDLLFKDTGMSAIGNLFVRTVNSQSMKTTDQMKEDAENQYKVVLNNYSSEHGSEYKDVLTKEMQSLGYRDYEDVKEYLINYYKQQKILEEYIEKHSDELKIRNISYLLVKFEESEDTADTVNEEIVIDESDSKEDEGSTEETETIEEHTPTEDEQSRMDAVDKAFDEGREFASIAEEFSEDPSTASEGGVLGTVDSTTHTFITINQGGIHENLYTDTIALDANQKYIYYKVRATDFSTNIGLWSPWLQVRRPHLSPPTVPHLYASSHSNERGIHLEWVVGPDEDMKRHLLYRRVGEQGKWQMIGRFDADSVRLHDNTIIVDDNPPYLQNDRYYYYVESVNASPFRSNSLAVSFNHRGPRVFDIPVKLSASYLPQENETRLVWELDASKLPGPGGYLCIYRKGPGEQKFTYQRNIPLTETLYIDHQMKQTDVEQQAEYYVHVQYADGRQGQESNTVIVKAPAKTTNP